MSILDSATIERLQFFNGQRLFAEDLQGIEAFNREMRWLHNSSLHQPGIGSGFAVTGQKGDRQVRVGPGYAIDVLGREIVLTQTHTLQVPPVSGDKDGLPAVFDLAVAYPADDLEEAETRGGLCGTQGVIRLSVAPIFCWVRLMRDDLGLLHPEPRFQAEILSALKIVLARVEVRNCQLERFVDISVRRDARPKCLPYIASGVADPTEWELVALNAQDLAGPSLYLRAEIDTKEAGFRSTPAYSVTVLGPHDLVFQGEGREGEQQEVRAVILDYPNVQAPRPDGFTLHVLLSIRLFFEEGGVDLTGPRVPEGLLLFRGLPILRRAAAADTTLDDFIAQWKAQWMGVEG
jgi:hypothetical protein